MQCSGGSDGSCSEAVTGHYQDDGCVVEKAIRAYRGAGNTIARFSGQSREDEEEKMNLPNCDDVIITSLATIEGQGSQPVGQ